MEYLLCTFTIHKTLRPGQHGLLRPLNRTLFLFCIRYSRASSLHPRLPHHFKGDAPWSWAKYQQARKSLVIVFYTKPYPPLKKKESWSTWVFNAELITSWRKSSSLHNEREDWGRSAMVVHSRDDSAYIDNGQRKCRFYLFAVVV